MIKLNVAYGKKVPGSQDYSSDSYHASVEIELSGDTSNWSEVNSAIARTFDDLKKSVEDQIAGKSAPVHEPSAQSAEPQKTLAGGTAGEGGKASEKQVKYLLSLAGRKGISPMQLAHQHGAASIGDLDRHVVSQLITELKED